MSAELTELALARKLITVAEALEQVGARDLMDLRLRAVAERKRSLRAA